MASKIPTFSALDLETAPVDDYPQVYALQPWRAQEGTARITSCAAVVENEKPMIADTRPKICQQLDFLRQSRTFVATWNGKFDISWLLAEDFDISGIFWVDALLLWKWLENGQRLEMTPDMSLVAGAKKFLRHVPWVDKFIALKKNEPPPGEKDEYWKIRAQFDALATKLIAEIVFPQLAPQQQKSALIEAKTLVPVANAVLEGIELDTALAEKMMPEITQEMEDIEHRLGLHTVQGNVWVPSKVLSSPKQLGTLIYKKWGLPLTFETPAGAPATDKKALTYLADYSDLALEILRWKELNTQFTKFIRGIFKTVDYLGTTKSRPDAKLFSTYTGRMTYRTKSGQQGEAAKARIGVPYHQWPRPKPLRELVRAPKGKALVEFDASGQEMRLMACQSKDPALLRIFNSEPPYDDVHSFMGAQISGLSFEAFLKGKADKLPAIVGPTGYRYQGKFTDLSCQYRISAKTLRIKSRVDYGMNKDFMTIQQWLNTYKRTFKGIPLHWTAAIKKAREQGYAESYGGRRFKLDFWTGDRRWGTEQSAINFPIQATGGDQKELALYLLTSKFPELTFFLDLHDGLYFYADINKLLPALIKEAKYCLDSMDYVKYWDWKPDVPLVWDASVGINWGKMQELKL